MTGTEQKRILVTGATGFVGRHLLAYLSTQACQVTVLCKPDDPLRCVLPLKRAQARPIWQMRRP